MRAYRRCRKRIRSRTSDRRPAPTNNSFNVEGIDNNDKGITGPIVYVPIDSIGQFSVLQNQFNPEFGFSSGGIFNSNIKSGTNSDPWLDLRLHAEQNLNAVDQQCRAPGTYKQPTIRPESPRRDDWRPDS